MSLTVGVPPLVNVGPGCVVTVLSSDDRRLVFPVCSLVLHEQDREAKL